MEEASLRKLLIWKNVFNANHLTFPWTWPSRPTTINTRNLKLFIALFTIQLLSVNFAVEMRSFRWTFCDLFRPRQFSHGSLERRNCFSNKKAKAMIRSLMTTTDEIVYFLKVEKNSFLVSGFFIRPYLQVVNYLKVLRPEEMPSCSFKFLLIKAFE